VGGRDALADRRHAYRHGALVVMLDGPEFAAVALARAMFDRGSAALIGPHVTLAPPFAEAPTSTALDRLREIASTHLPVPLAIGGAGRFGGSDVVDLRVEPPGPPCAGRAPRVTGTQRWACRLAAVAASAAPLVSALQVRGCVVRRRQTRAMTRKRLFDRRSDCARE
jgi:hypothetical protein